MAYFETMWTLYLNVQFFLCNNTLCSVLFIYLVLCHTHNTKQLIRVHINISYMFIHNWLKRQFISVHTKLYVLSTLSNKCNKCNKCNKYIASTSTNSNIEYFDHIYKKDITAQLRSSCYRTLDMNLVYGQIINDYKLFIMLARWTNCFSSQLWLVAH